MQKDMKWPWKKPITQNLRLKTISPINNNSNPKDINHSKNEIKITLHHFLITSLRIAITVESLATGKEIAESYSETNKIEIINVTLHHSNLIINHYQLTIHQDPNTKITIISLLIPQNQFTLQNQYQVNNNRISSNNQLVPQNSTQPRPNHYYTQPSYLTIPEEQNFYHTVLSEGRAAAQQQNPSCTPTTIPPARIAENANLSDIFLFEFEANKSPFLLSNAAANKQKAITAIYTEAEVEEKSIRLILDTQTVIVTADSMKKTPVGEIDNFSFTLDGITIPVKVLVIDAPQYQALTGKPKNYKSLTKDNMPKYLPFNILLHTLIPKPLDKISFTQSLNQRNNAPIFLLNIKTVTRNYHQWEPAFHLKKNMKIILGHLIKRSGKWDNTPCLTYGDIEEVCDQTCQYALSISKKVKRGTLFDAAYNSALNKLYHYPHDAEMIFDLAMALINRTTQENVRQMKESEYIAYIFEIAGYNYEDEVEVYHQIANYTYSTKEVQAQWLEQMNIKLCEECIMPCNEQWCSECYALNVPLPSKNNESKIEFGKSEATEKIKTTLIYLIESQPALQLKYFNNNGQGIKPEKAHEIDAGYDLRYSNKNTLVLKPKSLTKINLKIALKIPPGAMVQIASQSSLASKGINVRGGIIDAGYTGDITVMLQNETNKPFKIDHAEKIAQAIYLPLINISGLQLVNQREQLGKSNREIQGFGSTEQFTVPVNIALNTQNESHQILRLPQPITISPFGEHLEIYTCPKPTTTQQIFESNEQVCLEHNISIPNIYIPEGTKKIRVTFYNPNNYPIVLLNNLKIGVIYSNIFQQKLPQTVPNFLEIIGHLLPKINPNPSSENYHVVIKKLSRINMGQLESQQWSQLKELITEFADIFAENNNDLGRTNLVQHQIYTGDAKPRRQ
ncbi:hypothetical protein G9A89_008139 [Geosiphon pyriformis]|nr:hypothetical protein G9A89_008139 [Geosiphon pyriformis]